ncbi:Asp-tRNA(Asn)/Glu-tRNA(Gln) amidotransferase subunit GatA [Alicyclobacillus mali]|uniref:Glutamyl-tRNA(Gln) amidotransferase subunit A n=1 Tax=Alicyclobacillus mali (ex Roth et al. 2021) TaxID=1123961 RepID=A0ABS0F0G7_9BACL|nr:Asp-tRNA(Asn)/Glu-tRNA(Gln) amidotransferase subunit GatA [Alicyclobacillus mali (ex Roth et al. 2021)]MBF8376760.1 Asp-tRNA(Asn)/Glu-tRNA(Gln) amidotransferase subunit GatA [Alicyclobacillus mali (ex Roth et al. 2021)]MCL6488016.1 Asp-tRNA(Asn)/Glu-tRNA(Gln) amidotransferase subunit GatA [Alicyclobacillus mali (ex Roth et al. 2021)]
MRTTTVKEILRSISAGETRARDWVEHSLRAIREVDGRLKAFLLVDEEHSLAAADRIDRAKMYQHAPLRGVPYAAKDNIVTRGVRTTAASRILENYIPPYNATVIDKLQQAAAVMVGKTNMDEFAMGSSTETSAFQKTANPYGEDRVPGGSSGGSAAAVAAGLVPFALGSDTGGSIRQPAAFTGCFGMKPTYGRVSRYGLIAFASSLDQIGPFTRTAEDAALVLNAICGHDPLDSTSSRQPVPNFADGIDRGVKGVRVGIVRHLPEEGLEPGVKAAVHRAIQQLEAEGAEIVEIELPHMEYAVATYYLIAPAEASSNLARYDGVRYGRRAEASSLLEMYERSRSEGFGMEVKRRIIIGTYALSSGYYDAYYKRAQQMRTLIRQDYERAFEACDVIVMPTAPTTAFKLGEKLDNPLQMYLNDIYTIPANLAGLPGASVPCGFADGLPVGLQLIGRPFDEATILRVAHAYEQVRDFAWPKPVLGVAE